MPVNYSHFRRDVAKKLRIEHETEIGGELMAKQTMKGLRGRDSGHNRTARNAPRVQMEKEGGDCHAIRRSQANKKRYNSSIHWPRRLYRRHIRHYLIIICFSLRDIWNAFEGNMLLSPVDVRP